MAPSDALLILASIVRASWCDAEADGVVDVMEIVTHGGELPRCNGGPGCGAVQCLAGTFMAIGLA